MLYFVIMKSVSTQIFHFWCLSLKILLKSSYSGVKIYKKRNLLIPNDDYARSGADFLGIYMIIKYAASRMECKSKS